MDPATSGEPPPPPPLVLCPCDCPFCCSASASTWHRSVKRKADAANAQPSVASARVGAELEVAALRDTVTSQLETIQELSAELEEERNAASSAASEAMAMILRLQREKAEAQMEARQFKRFAEEKMAHDHEELLALEDLLLKRDEALQSLSSKLYSYRLKLQKLGVSESDLGGEMDELLLHEYPPLKCNTPTPDEHEYQVEGDDVEMYAFGDTPEGNDENLQDLEQRIFELEKEEERENEELVEDDTSDRVYTIDAVYGTTPTIRVSDEEMEGKEGEGVDIKKLYMRLESLEADRESMRQALISMRTEKAQLVLLQEIAQQLSKEVVHERKVVKKKSLIQAFSVITLFKWLLSLVFNRKKATRIRYTFGITSSNVGLLLLLDKTPQMNHFKCHAKIRINFK